MHSYAEFIEMKRANERKYALVRHTSYTLSCYIFLVREEMKAV